VSNDLAHHCLGFLLGIFLFERYSLELAAAHDLDLIIRELAIPTAGTAFAHSNWHELKIVTAACLAAIRSLRHAMCGRACLHLLKRQAVLEKVIRALATLFRSAGQVHTLRHAFQASAKVDDFVMPSGLTWHQVACTSTDVRSACESLRYVKEWAEQVRVACRP
jgi:hypothetical protein